MATYDYAIGGKLITATITVSSDNIAIMKDDGKVLLKHTLVNMIVKEMIENGFVEFTQADDMVTGFRVIRARAYVAPDSQVKILRSLKKV